MCTVYTTGAAPGASRMKIEPSLSSRSRDVPQVVSPCSGQHGVIKASSPERTVCCRLPRAPLCQIQTFMYTYVNNNRRRLDKRELDSHPPPPPPNAPPPPPRKLSPPPHRGVHAASCCWSIVVVAVMADGNLMEAASFADKLTDEPLSGEAEALLREDHKKFRILSSSSSRDLTSS